MMGLGPNITRHELKISFVNQNIFNIPHLPNIS